MLKFETQNSRGGGLTNESLHQKRIETQDKSTWLLLLLFLLISVEMLFNYKQNWTFSNTLFPNKKHFLFFAAAQPLLNVTSWKSEDIQKFFKSINQLLFNFVVILLWFRCDFVVILLLFCYFVVISDSFIPNPPPPQLAAANPRGRTEKERQRSICSRRLQEASWHAAPPPTQSPTLEDRIQSEA